VTKNEFIQRFIEENGFLPDEGTLQELFPIPIGRNPGQISYLNGQRRTRNRGEDLLGEVKDIFNDLAAYARTAAKKKPRNLLAAPWTSELGYMVLVFAAKAGLYFVLQSSYRDGYDFSNI